MKRFIEGKSRSQSTLLPECLDDYITEDNPVRAVEAFVDELFHQVLEVDFSLAGSSYQLMQQQR